MEWNRPVPESERLRILCMLPTLNPYGGVVSVVNLLNILADRGHHVTLLSMSEISRDDVHPRMEPMFHPKGDPIGDAHAAHDIFMATWWETAPPIADLHRRRGSGSAFYFIQDIESDFYPEEDVTTREAVHATYDLIPNRLVKTAYLEERLRAAGVAAHRIPPGMDLDIYYPRSGAPSTRPPGVVAMARPGSSADHRGFEILQAVYRSIADTRPDVALASFGASLDRDELPGTNHGRLEPSQLPALYSAHPVYVDVSRVHGFGRTGVEAMACGCATVLSASGGVSEYARDGENAIMVPVGDVDATVAAIIDLLADPSRMDRLAAQASVTVADFSDYRAANVVENLFRSSLAAP